MTPRTATAALAMCALLLGGLWACSSLRLDPVWEGKKIDEAIARYGPPTRVSPTPLGKTYVWEFAHGSGALPGGGGNTVVIKTIRMMTVDANGIITSYNRFDQ
jgi:hypothetical protein